MPLAVALISDDLTGALDAAAPFVTAGMRCVVATEVAGIATARSHDPDVIAVSTSSREIPAEAAARRVAEAAEALAGALWIFKKIDSRLKGNIAAETRALLDRRRGDRVLISPAIPALGRMVQAGAVTGQGVERPIAVAPVLAGCSPFGPVIPDVASDADLDAALALETPAALLVGARGLAAALARRLAPRAGVATPHFAPRGPVAFLIGSRDPITLAQVAWLREHQPGIPVVLAPNGQVPWAAPRTLAGDVIVQVSQGPQPAAAAEVAARLAKAFAERVAPGHGTLLLTGGETAAAVLDCLGIRALALLGEVEPAVPLALPLDFPNPPFIVTKSGGLGSETCLGRLMEQTESARGAG